MIDGVADQPDEVEPAARSTTGFGGEIRCYFGGAEDQNLLGSGKPPLHERLPTGREEEDQRGRLEEDRRRQSEIGQPERERRDEDEPDRRSRRRRDSGPHRAEAGVEREP